MTDVPDTASGTASWRRWRMAARAWGPPGNERLTSLLAGVIVALATYPAQQSWLSHKHHHHERDARSSSAKTTAGDLGGH